MWDYLRWFAYGFLVMAAFSFLVEEASAAVYGHDSATSCENAMAAIMAGNSPHGTKYIDEIDFHAKSNQAHYLKDGKCYNANKDVRRLIDYQQAFQIILPGGAGFTVGVRALGVYKGSIRKLNITT